MKLVHFSHVHGRRHEPRGPLDVRQVTEAVILGALVLVGWASVVLLTL